MSNVPQARVILRDVVKQLKTGTITRMGAAKVVSATLPLLVRNSPVRRSPRRKRYVTQSLIRQIKAMARQNPLMHLDDIAAHFGVNPGRVSEILNGKR